jgi:hypothetical protein
MRNGDLLEITYDSDFVLSHDTATANGMNTNFAGLPLATMTTHNMEAANT